MALHPADVGSLTDREGALLARAFRAATRLLGFYPAGGAELIKAAAVGPPFVA